MFSLRSPSHVSQLLLVLAICAASSGCGRATPTVDDLELGDITIAVPRVACLESVEERLSSESKAAVHRKVESVGFVFYLPSLDRCDGRRSADDFNEDRVQFSVQSSTPDQAGHHPHADIDGALKRLEGVALVAGPATDIDGLACFPMLPDHREQECMGISATGERFLISVRRSPYEDWVKFPLAQTTYFSKEFGGVQILWRVHAKHIGKWRQIEAHAWNMLKSWAVVSQGQQANPTGQK
jgi:hypothetical protein